jgi:hypothetical protein
MPEMRYDNIDMSGENIKEKKKNRFICQMLE